MTTTGTPIEAVWTGEVFQPVSPYWQRRADKEFARGEVLRLTHNAERSSKSHARYFARVHEAWASLPPILAEQYPSDDHFRRFCLIKAGYCTTQHMPCGTHEAALKFAAFVRPLDSYALVQVQGSVVYVFRAESQSYKAMGKQRFQESAAAVEGVIEDILQVSKRELSAAGAAA